jgi:flagellar protein FliS
MYAQGIKEYQKVSTQTSIVDADPHRLVQLLFEGATSRISAAKGHIERKEYDKKSNQINSAINIIGGLQESLNFDAGELAYNLERLYDYQIRRLFEANIRNDIELGMRFAIRRYRQWATNGPPKNRLRVPAQR